MNKKKVTWSFVGVILFVLALVGLARLAERYEEDEDPS